jgi:hypothetical protein
MAKDKYDFDFITLALGLVPIQAGIAAINPAAITSMQFDAVHGNFLLSMHGGTKYALTVEDMAELEETIKRRGEEAKAIQKEAMRNQLITQQEVFTEINNRVQPGQIIGAIPTKRRQN